MKKNDFKNPLIQSGAVLIFVFLLISIVAGSGSQGVWGSIGALFSGLVSGIIFLIALIVAIIVSIAVIIGLFIAAVSIYSVDKGREMGGQLIAAINALFQKMTGSGRTVARMSVSTTDASPSSPGRSTDTEADLYAERLTSLDVKLSRLDTKLSELAKASASQEEAIAQLRQQIEGIADSDSIDTKFADVTVSHQALETRIEALAAELVSGADARKQVENRLTGEVEKIQEELKALHEKTSIPDTVSGILSYIDLPEDRDLVTEKAMEAVSRGMTYSQIDDFFKTSLKPEVYGELASHPRLTKDFLRSIKKKF